MTAPLVSVVIPAYNAARTLEATVRSVQAQTVQDFEIIIVDDGSKDDTLAVARSIVDERIRVISQANGGVAAARNTGIKGATGKYVALLDADDLWLPHKLERQLAVLEGENNVFAVQAGAIFVDDSLGTLSVRPCFPSQDALLETLLFQNMPNNMSTLIIARHKFEEMGYFDTELEILEEWDMAIKVARYCNLVSIEEPLSLYRVHPGNRSRNLDIHIKPGHLVLERLFTDPNLPPYIRKQKRRIHAHFYTMLAGGAFRVGRLAEFGKWAIKAVLTHPESLSYMAALPLRRLQRYSSRKNSDVSAKAVSAV
ncbi:MAG TPA: glycosyltransferase [Blastocatellia bacterium]|nr:glycosyltransferase [Blastocatellia bacterium]